MSITQIAWGVGIVYILAGLALAVGPPWIRRALAGFPRHRWAGVILAAIAIAWTAFMLWHSPLGWFEPYRRWIPVLAAVIYLLTIFLVDDLLAPRAAGGLMLLAAAPLLDTIRWEPTPWRLVLTLQAYLWVVAGMIITFSPFRFRRVCEWIHQSRRRAGLAGGLLIATGGVIVLLALTLYPRSIP